jgi:hypothetical protein
MKSGIDHHAETAVGSRREGFMVTRYFEPAVPVLYRTESGWRGVLALGVRRFDDTYTVLITCPYRGARTTSWVPRSRVRAEDPCSRLSRSRTR